MNSLIFFVVLAAFIACVYAGDENVDKLSKINIDEVLGNDRLFKKYLSCLVAPEPVKDPFCLSGEAKDLKERLPKAIESGCKDCDEKQKEQVKKIIKNICVKDPKAWKQLQEKYDPEGKQLATHPDLKCEA